MANAIQIYAANKACCIATNVKETDNKIKYGTEDVICCINKDFIASTFIELLMCNSVASDTTWYKMVATGSLVDNVPSEFPGTVTHLDKITITSYDGSITSTLLDFSNTSITASSIVDLNIKIFDRFKEGITLDTSLLFTTESINESTGKMIVNIYYTSDWGDATNLPTFLLSTFIDDPTMTSNFTYTTSSTTVNNNSCLTSAQLCNIKNWLDDYCQSC